MKIKQIKTNKKNIPWKWILISFLSLLILFGIGFGIVILSKKSGEKRNFTTIKFEDVEYEYDGLEKEIVVKGLPSNATVSYEPTNHYVEAGSYTVKAIVTAKNYNKLELTATLKIIPYYKVTFHQFHSGTGPEYTYSIKVKEGESVSLDQYPSIAPVDGVILAWEEIDLTNIHNNIDVRQTFSFIPYTVTLHYANGDIDIINFSVAIVPLNLPVDDSIIGTFFGWYPNTDYNEDEVITQITEAGNIELYSRIVDSSPGLSFYYYADHAEVQGYTGTESHIIIPKESHSLPVTSIKAEAFMGNNTMEIIDIFSENISLGDKAFRECLALKEIHLSGMISNMGDRVFSNCFSLQSFTINQGTTFLSTYFLSYALSLKEIVLPSTLSEIQSYAFNECSQLKYIFFEGTQEQWNNIQISEQGNSSLTKLSPYIYSENTPNLEGQYWHYVDGLPEVWS